MNESDHSLKITAKFFGISEVTVRNALRYELIPFVPRKTGRNTIPGPRELLHIEISTIPHRRMTGHQ